MRKILLPLILGMSITACAQTVALQDELTAVRAVWDASVEAALDGNYDGWAAVFAEDVEIANPDVSMHLVGQPEVEATYRPALEAAIFSNIVTKRFDVKISSNGDIAWGTAAAEVTAGGETSTSWYALVYRKEKGTWKMVLGYNARAKTDGLP